MAIPNVARRAMAVGLLAGAFVAGCGDSDGGPSAPSDDLSVTAIVPDVGLATASTAIQIRGTGFVTGMNVSVAGAQVNASVVNSTTIAATLRPHAVGSVDVRVSRGLGRGVTVPGGFTYVPQPTAMAISGNFNLVNVGDRTQLTATATFADGSTRNVTSASRWSTSQSSILGVSPDGLVTALAEGAASVFASFPPSGGPSRVGTAFVSVTPVGTFATAGRIREPGAGNLGGVRVTNPASGRFIMAGNGEYSFAGLTDNRLVFTRDDYETAEIRATANGSDDVPMQRVLRLTAGGPALASQIVPNDTSYDVGGAACLRCRLIRINGGAGTLTVRLTWTSQFRVLSLWVNGVRLSGSAGSRELTTTITAGSEVIVYVSSPDVLEFSEHIPFSISVG